MEPPEELAAVDWSALAHGYGCADDIPDLVRALYAPDEALSADAEEELSADLLVDDRPHSATAPVIPFVAHAALHLPARRGALLRTLADLAHTGPGTHPQAPAVRAALRDALGDLLPTLHDLDPDVRRTAVRLGALVGGDVPQAVVPPLLALCHGDPVPEVRADALTALARVDPGSEAVLDRERLALADPAPAVRVAAALLLAERSEPPYPYAVVEALADHGGSDTDAENQDFPLLGTRRERLTEALRADPDAALLASVHWIAQGDRFSHGSELAEQVALVWRDREHEIVDTLAAALPHHRDSSSLRALLERIARQLPCGPGDAAGSRPVPAELPETLLRYADDPRPWVSQAAVTALARCGDERALDRATAPGLAALVSFARDPRALGHLRTALRIGERQHNRQHLEACWVLDRLGPALAARLVPELTDLLDLPLPMAPAAALLGGLGPQLAADPEGLAQLVRVMAALTQRTQRAEPAVAHARLTGGLDSRTLPVLRAAVAFPPRAADAWTAVELLGPLGAPLLPQVRAAGASDRPPQVRLAAAAAYRRITGDARPAVEAAAACLTGPRRPGAPDLRLRAVSELAAVGAAPEPLRPLLHGFATAERRVLSGSGLLSPARDDEQLRCCARLLL